jgi:hypothetical protein
MGDGFVKSATDNSLLFLHSLLVKQNTGLVLLKQATQ